MFEGVCCLTTPAIRYAPGVDARATPLFHVFCGGDAERGTTYRVTRHEMRQAAYRRGYIAVVSLPIAPPPPTELEPAVAT